MNKLMESANFVMPALSEENIKEAFEYQVPRTLHIREND